MKESSSIAVGSGVHPDGRGIVYIAEEDTGRHIHWLTSHEARRLGTALLQAAEEADIKDETL